MLWVHVQMSTVLLAYAVAEPKHASNQQYERTDQAGETAEGAPNNCPLPIVQCLVYAVVVKTTPKIFHPNMTNAYTGSLSHDQLARPLTPSDNYPDRDQVEQEDTAAYKPRTLYNRGGPDYSTHKVDLPKVYPLPDIRGPPRPYPPKIYPHSPHYPSHTHNQTHPPINEGSYPRQTPSDHRPDKDLPRPYNGPKDAHLYHNDQQRHPKSENYPLPNLPKRYGPHEVHEQEHGDGKPEYDPRSPPTYKNYEAQAPERHHHEQRPYTHFDQNEQHHEPTHYRNEMVKPYNPYEVEIDPRYVGPRPGPVVNGDPSQGPYSFYVPAEHMVQTGTSKYPQNEFHQRNNQPREYEPEFDRSIVPPGRSVELPFFNLSPTSLLGPASPLFIPNLQQLPEPGRGYPSHTVPEYPQRSPYPEDEREYKRTADGRPNENNVSLQTQEQGHERPEYPFAHESHPKSYRNSRLLALSYEQNENDIARQRHHQGPPGPPSPAFEDKDPYYDLMAPNHRQEIDRNDDQNYKDLPHHPDQPHERLAQYNHPAPRQYGPKAPGYHGQAKEPYKSQPRDHPQYSAQPQQPYHHDQHHHDQSTQAYEHHPHRKPDQSPLPYSPNHHGHYEQSAHPYKSHPDEHNYDSQQPYESQRHGHHEQSTQPYTPHTNKQPDYSPYPHDAHHHRDHDQSAHPYKSHPNERHDDSNEPYESQRHDQHEQSTQPYTSYPNEHHDDLHQPYNSHAHGHHDHSEQPYDSHAQGHNEKAGQPYESHRSYDDQNRPSHEYGHDNQPDESQKSNSYEQRHQDFHQHKPDYSSTQQNRGEKTLHDAIPNQPSSQNENQEEGEGKDYEENEDDILSSSEEHNSGDESQENTTNEDEESAFGTKIVSSDLGSIPYHPEFGFPNYATGTNFFFRVPKSKLSKYESKLSAE